jgi:hypothetical protein
MNNIDRAAVWLDLIEKEELEVVEFNTQKG